MSQDSCSEEDFALAHSEQVVIQLQSFDLNRDNIHFRKKGFQHFVRILQLWKTSNHQFRCLFAVHEGSRNGVGS